MQKTAFKNIWLNFKGFKVIIIRREFQGRKATWEGGGRQKLGTVSSLVSGLTSAIRMGWLTGRHLGLSVNANMLTASSELLFHTNTMEATFKLRSHRMRLSRE